MMTDHKIELHPASGLGNGYPMWVSADVDGKGASCSHDRKWANTDVQVQLPDHSWVTLHDMLVARQVARLYHAVKELNAEQEEVENEFLRRTMATIGRRRDRGDKTGLQVPRTYWEEGCMYAEDGQQMVRNDYTGRLEWHGPPDYLVGSVPSSVMRAVERADREVRPNRYKMASSSSNWRSKYA